MLPIGVGQTVSRPAISPPPDRRPARARPSSPRRSSRPRARAPRPATGVSFIGGRARARELRAGRPEQQLAGRRSRRRRSRSRRARRCSPGSRAPRRSAVPISATTSTAPSRRPPRARSVTSVPVDSARRRPGRGPAPSRGALGARPGPRGASAVPDASDSTQPWLGSSPGRAGRSTSIDDVAELGGGPGRSPIGRAVEDQAAADPRSDRQHDDVRARPGRRRTGARRARRGWRRCRSPPGARAARSSGPGSARRRASRLTALIATPRSRSIVQGIPSPIGSDVGAGLERLAELALERREQLVLAQAGARRRSTCRATCCVGVHDPDEHLGAAEVDADRLGHQPPPVRTPSRKEDLRAGHAAVLPVMDRRPEANQPR